MCGPTAKLVKMKISYITGVTFHKLQKKCDRRGVIATFDLEQVPNWEYVQHLALHLLWRITSLLSEHYNPRTHEEISDRYYMSEGNDCWIAKDVEAYKIRVSHKYWSEAQIECFKEMIISLAKLHEWKVVDEACKKYVYRGLPIPHDNCWYIGGTDGNGGGVLEWCTSEEDAQQMLERMKKYPQFHDLAIGKWVK